MVAVQVEENAPALDRDAQGAEDIWRAAKLLPESLFLLKVHAKWIFVEKRLDFDCLNRAGPRPEHT